VTNTSSQTATNLDISDTLPAGITYVAASATGPGATYTSGTNTVSWAIPSLGASANSVLTFEATVNSGTAGTTITNSASLVGMTQTEDTPLNNTGSVDINPVGLDISVVKAVSNATPTEGDEITYTITVENLSSQTATNINVSDIVPSVLTFVTGSETGPGASYDGGTTTVSWLIPTLAGGFSETLTFRADVDAGASASNPITNTASFTGADQSDDQSSNDSGSVDINVQTFDVSVAKAVSDPAPEEGELITYTISVTNVTPSVLGTNIEITDVVPSGVTYEPGTISGGDSRDDSNPSTTGLTWNIASIGAIPVDLTFQARPNTGSAALGVITNTATRTASDQVDSDSGNDSGTADIDPIGLDIEVLKTVSNTTPEEGETLTYTITVNNLSSQVANNVDIEDILPNGVTYVSGTIAGGDSSSDASPSAAPGLQWTINTIPGSGSVTLAFDARVNTGARTLNPITNNANLADLDQTEDNPVNNTGTAVINVVGLDIAVAKAVSNSTPTEGDDVTYTITVENLSSQEATNVQITDPVPGQLTYVGGSILGGNVQDDSSPATGLIWTINTLPANGTAILTFEATVNGGASAFNPITNSASLTAIDQSEEDNGNNTGSVNLDAQTFDASLAKVVSNPTPEEGETITYTLTLTNDTPSITGTNILVRDPLPSGVTYVGGSISGGDVRVDTDPSGTGLEWTVNSLGATPVVLTFDVIVDVGARAFNPITNQADIISSDQFDSNTANNTATVNINVVGLDIEVRKAVSVATPEEGETITYSIEVENLSSQEATNVNVSDIVPGGVTYVAASAMGPGATYTGGTNTVSWLIPSLASGDTETLTFQVSVDTGARALNPITNNAVLGALDQSEENTGNNTGSVDINVVGLDISVTKAVSNSLPTEGDPVTYTITVQNLSSQVATNVQITDPVPAQLTYVAATIAGGTTRDDSNPGTGLIWNISTIPANGSVDLTFDATVNGGAAAFNPITNSASLSAIDQSEEDNGNNTGSVDITAQTFDASVVKAVNNSSPEEGETITYTITVTNETVTVDGTNIEISDVLPNGVTYVAASAVGPGATYTAGTNTVSWTIPSLLGGDSEVLSFEATVDTGAVLLGTITNTATRTASDQFDSNSANDNGSVDITPVGLDIQIQKNVNNDEPIEGETITYSIIATNLSSQLATGVVVNDLVPNGVTYVGGSISGGNVQDDSTPDTGSGLEWTINNLPASSSVTLTFDATVDAGAQASLGTVTNTASLDRIDQTEDNVTNNTDDQIITIQPFDVGVNKTVSVTEPTEGQTITYTIEVENFSSVAATNVTVSDIIPPGLTYVPASIAGGNSQDDSTPSASPGLQWTINSIPAGSSVNVTFDATVDAGAQATYGTITNTGTLVSLDQVDGNPSNDNNDVTITVRGIDISINKTVNQVSPSEGETITYTLTVTNLSTLDATNVTVNDLVPSALTYVGGTILGGDTQDEATPNSGSGLEWIINTLPGSASVALTFDATVNAGAAAFNPITNTGNITSLDQTDENSANDTSSIDINAVGLDLQVVKNVDNSTPVEGETVTYTLAVTNLSVQDATTVVLRDILPPGITYVGGSAAGGDSQNEADPSGAGLTWTINTLAGGATETVTFSATVDLGSFAAYGTITNTGTLDSTDQTEENSGNNVDTEDIVIQSIDVVMDKTVSDATPNEGETITYTLEVSNPSGFTATNIVVNDILPAGVTYVGGSISGGDTQDESTPSTGNGLEWTIASLPGNAPGNVVNLTFDVVVNNGARALGPVVNAGEVTSIDQTDSDPSNDRDTVSFTARGVEMSIAKTVNDTNPIEQDIVTYTLSVTNNGPADATNVVITDIVPSGVTYQAATMTGGDIQNDADPSGAGLTWTINSMPAGLTLNLTFQGQVDVGTGGTVITNTGSITSTDQTEEDLSNQDDSVDIVVQAIVDIVVTKVSDKADYEEGEVVTYTITVTNDGPSLASNIEIRDIVPNDIAYSIGTITGGDVQDETDPTGTGLLWTINSLSPLLPSNSVTLTFMGVVQQGANLNTPVVNTAEKIAVAQTEDDPSNDTDIASINILNNLDLSVAKSVSNATPSIGDIITYTIDVTNAGPTQASNVVINDIIPNGVIYLSGTDAGADSVSASDPQGAGVDFTINTINSGATSTITFNVLIDANSNLLNPITNTALLSAVDQTDTNNGNDSDSVDINVNSDLDISVVKTVDIPMPFEFEEVVYTITVTNNGPAAASNVEISDLLNAGLNYTAASMTGGDTQNDATPNGGAGLVWNINQILSGDSVTLTFRAEPGAGTSGTTISNTGAMIALDQPDTDNSNDSGSIDITVRNDADLQIVKTVDNNIPAENQTINYTLTVVNAGPSVSRNVVINDLIPAGVTYVNGSISGGDTQDEATPDSGSGLSWTINEMLNGAAVVLTFQATVDVGEAGNTIRNTADIVSFTSTESDPANNTSFVDITVDNSVDLQIVKTVSDNNPSETDVITYTIAVTNNGPNNQASQINITDVVPAGLTYVNGSISGGDTQDESDPVGSGLNWIINTLDVGNTVNLSFSASVDARTAGSTIVNNLVFNGFDQIDSNISADDLSESITVNDEIDLQLVKTVSRPDPSPTEVITYTITLTNNGPTLAENITVNDVVPANMTYQVASATGGTSINDSDPNGAGITWTINEILVGQTITMTFDAAPELALLNQTVTNTATYTNPYTDTTPNDSPSVDITVVGRADLVVTKTVDNGTPAEFENIVYTVDVQNRGPINVTDLVVVDQLPAGLTYISDNSGGNYNSGNGEWTVGFVPAGSSVTIEITAQPNAGTGGTTITNTVTALNTLTVDTNVTPDDPSEDITVIENTDIYINGVVTNANPNEQEVLTFTFDIENRGPTTGTNLTLETVLPPGLTYIPATQTGGDVSNVSGSTLTWDINTLNVSSVEPLTFQVSVDPGQGGNSLSVIMNLTALDQTEDPGPADDNQVDLIIGNETDLFFTKVADINNADEGDLVTFTITANNNGPTRARNLEITDVLSSFFTLETQVASLGSYTGNIWTIGNLDSGANATLTLGVRVNAGASGQTIVNRLENQSMDQVDTNLTVDDLEETVIIGANTDVEVLLSIIDDPGNDGLLEENQVFTYQVSVRNIGPSQVTNYGLDVFNPSQVTFINGSETLTSGTYTFPRWTIPSINVGDTEVFTIQATVNSGTYGQTATTNVTNITLDQTDGNLTADDLLEVFNIDDEIDLYITKTVDVSAPNEGDQINFFVTVENRGPADATGIVIEDIFPDTFLTLENAAPTVGTFNTGTRNWNISSLTPGQTAVLTITARVRNGSSGQTITNVVQVNALDQTDNNLTPDDLSETLNVDDEVDLEISKVVSNPAPNEGEVITYSLTIRNNGPSAATNFSLTDAIPAGLTVQGTTANIGTYASDVWSIPNLPNGFIAILDIQALVDYGTGGTMIRNEITNVLVDQTDNIGAANDTLIADININHETDFFIEKVADQAVYSEGDTVIFTITSNNNGPALVQNSSMQDVIPSGLTYQSHTTTNATVYDSLTGVWTLGDVPVGQTDILEITATVDPGTNGSTIVNQITNVVLDETDNEATPDDLDESILIVNDLDIAVSIASDLSQVDEQDEVTITINAINLGPARATGIVLNYLTPSQFDFVSATPDEGTYDGVTGDWTIPDLNVTESTNLVVVLRAREGEGGQTVSISSSLTAVNQNEIQPVNNSDSVDVEINHINDLTVTKVVDNNVPREGETVRFTLEVTNAGPAQSQNLILTDPMPAGLTFTSTENATQGTYNGTTWNIGSLSEGATARIDILATVNAGTNGQTITNLITNVSQDETDSIASDDLDEVLVIDRGVDLQIDKTVNNPTPAEGETIEFTIALTNNGPITITNLLLDDPMPAGLTFVGAQTPTAGTFTNPQWTIPSIAVGVTETIVLEATVDVGTANTTITNLITNIAMDQDDETPANNDLEEAVTIANEADLVVTKVVDNSNPNESDSVIYTIQVVNNGPAQATNVALTDVIPSGLTLISSAPSVGSFTNDIWTIGTLNDAQVETIQLTAQVNVGQSGNTIVNQVTNVVLDQNDSVSAGDDLDEPITVGNTLDLAVNISVSDANVDEGQDFTYTIDVTNNGPNQASNLSITDLWPAGLEIVSANSPDFNTGSFVWNIGTLPAAASRQVVITARARAGTSGSTINNAITYALDQTDSSSGDVLDVDVQVNNDVDLVIAHTVDNDRPNELDTIRFSVVATNNGPARATNVSYEYTLPPGLTFSSATPGTGSSFGTDTWTIPQIEAGESVTLNIEATVNSGTAGTTFTVSVTNQALDQTDSNITADDFDEEITVRNESDIYVTKVADQNVIFEEDEATFIITVENRGPLNLNTLTVDDEIPAGLDIISITPNRGTFTAPTWDIGALNVGETAELTIRTRVQDETENTSIVNTVTNIVSDRADSNLTPDDLTESLDILGASSVSISISYNKDVVEVGDFLGVTVELESLIENDLNPLVTNLTLPQGLSYIPESSTIVLPGDDGQFGTEDDVSGATTNETITSLSTNYSLNVNGRSLAFSYDTSANSRYQFRFLTRVGATALGSELVTTASSSFDSVEVTSLVSAIVIVQNSAISDLTNIIGKVFHDRDGDGYQDDARASGVKVYGGTPLENVIHGTEEVTYGDGFMPVSGGAERGYRIGSLDSKKTLTDEASKNTAVLRVQVREKILDDLVVKSKQGFRTLINSDGETAYRHTRTVKKGMNSQNLVVNRFIKEVDDKLWLYVSVKNLGVQEEGMPGVRVIGVDGLTIETDEFGRFHIADVETIVDRMSNYILKVDLRSLPKNTIMTTENPRVVRLTGGLHTKFNFGVKIKEKEVKVFTRKKFTEIFFKTGKFQIEESEEEKVEEIQDSLSQLPLDDKDAKVYIQGFADYRGPSSLNKELSLNRAQTVLKRFENIRPDLHYKLSVDNDNPNERDEITFTAVVENRGLGEVYDLMIDLPIDQHLSLVKSKSSNGNYDSKRWYIGNLEGKESAKLSITVKVKEFTSDEKFVMMAKSYIYKGIDEIKDIKDVVAVGKVKNETDLEVTVTSSLYEVDEREEFKLTYAVTNHGPAAATGLGLKLSALKKFDIKSISPDKGVLNKYKWNIGNLRYSETAKLVVVMSAKVGTATDSIDVSIADVKVDQEDTDQTSDLKELVVQVKNNLDLQVIGLFSKPKSVEGEVLYYDVLVLNKGPILATKVVSSIEIDDSFEVVGVKSSSGNYKSGEWMIPKIPVGRKEKLRFALKPVSGSGGSELRNEIYNVIQDQIDLDTSKDIYAATNTVLNTTDIIVTKSVSNERPAENERVRFTWTVENKGPARLDNFELKDSLSNNLVSIGKRETTEGKTEGITWRIDTLEVGKTAVMTEDVYPVSGTGKTTIVDKVESVEHEQKDSRNNSRLSAKVTVDNTTDIELLKSFNTNDAEEGDTVWTKFKIVNKGPALAQNIIIKDYLPEQFKNNKNYKYSKNSKLKNNGWSIESLAVGEEANISWESTIAAGSGSDVIVDKVDSITMDEDFRLNEKEAYSPRLVVRNSTDLKVVLKSDKRKVELGEELEYSLTIENKGPARVEGLRMKMNLDKCLRVLETDSPELSINGSKIGIKSLDVDKSVEAKITVIPNYSCPHNSFESNISDIKLEQKDLNSTKDIYSVRTEIDDRSDLHVSVSSEIEELHENQVVDFRIHVQNNGPAFINNGFVEFETSESLEIIKYKATNRSPEAFKWNFDNLKKGASETLRIRARVKFNTYGRKAFIKVVNVETNKKDINTTKDISLAKYTVKDDVDLVVSIRPEKADINTPYITYVYEIFNKGPGVATNIKLNPEVEKENLRKGSIAISSNSSYKYGSWKVDILYPGESAKLTSKHEIKEFKNEIKDATYAGLEFDQTDSNQSSDLLNVDVNIINIAKVKLKKEISISKPKVGDVFFYTYTLENKGTQLARDIKVKDLFNEKELKSDGEQDCTLGDCSSQSTWTIKQLAPGETAILQIPVKLISITGGQKYISDPVDVFTMEQSNYYDLEKMTAFRYRAENIERGVAGENDDEQ